RGVTARDQTGPEGSSGRRRRAALRRTRTMSDHPPVGCPDCGEGISRREFVRKATGIAVAGGLLPLVPASPAAAALARDGPTPSSSAETAVKRFYDPLTEAQKKVVCFPFDHDLRKRINANWAITKPTIEEFFTKDQQVILDEIFRGVVSPEAYGRF